MRNIVFDLDGTLLDSAPDILRVLAEILSDHRIEPRVPVGRQLIGPPISEMLAQLLPEAERERLPEFHGEFRRRYDANSLPDTQPYPRIVECLEVLKAHGCRLFVATNKPKHVSLRLIEQRLGARFERLVTVDSVAGRVLDKPGMLALLGLDPKESVMIGDQPADIRAGKELGFATMAVLFGYGRTDELCAQSPDYTVTCPGLIAPTLGFR